MKKNIIKSIIFALCSGLYITTMAASQVDLQNGIETVVNNTEWKIESEAPQLKITIKDAYIRAGKIQKVILQLDGANWIYDSGSSIRPIAYENLKSTDIAVGRNMNGELFFNVAIPKDIKREEVISFTIPLTIKVDESEEKDEIYAWIRPGENSDLIDEEDVLLAVKSNKKLLWELGEIPQIVDGGSIGNITLTEVNQYALGKDEAEVTLKLQNDNLAFGSFEYIDEQKNMDDTYYILKPNQYISYQGGFEGFDAPIRLTVPKSNNQQITFKIKGKVTSEIGSIVLKNIPIINLKEDVTEENVYISLQGEALVKPQKDILVAHLATQVYEEGKEEIEVEENKDELKDNIANQVKFKVGANYFMVNDEKHEMPGTTYIQDTGYVMVPVRYVAYALGADKDKVSFKDSKVTIQYKDRKLELKVGSEQAIINKSVVSMQTALIVKNGISYAPIGEIANLLGVEKEWDSIHKEATFYN